MIPVSTRPTGPAPGRMRCSSSRRGSLRGLSVGLAGGMMESRASSRVVPLALPSLRSTFHPLYQDMLVLVCNMLSPCQPEMGTNGTAPTCPGTRTCWCWSATCCLRASRRWGRMEQQLGCIRPSDEARDFLLDFLKPSLAVWGLGGVHLVDSNDELLDSQGVSQQGVFSGL